jgi:hypothetical protein
VGTQRLTAVPSARFAVSVLRATLDEFEHDTHELAFSYEHRSCKRGSATRFVCRRFAVDFDAGDAELVGTSEVESRPGGERPVSYGGTRDSNRGHHAFQAREPKLGRPRKCLEVRRFPRRVLGVRCVANSARMYRRLGQEAALVS